MPLANHRKRLAGLIPELAKFGVVGMTGAVIDLGGADYLHVHLGLGPMVAKGLSITAATLVTYLGSRYWTFRHRVNQNMLREGVLFVVLNLIGLGIAEAVIASTTYGLDKRSELAYNVASLAGTGLGTIFRYFSYKKWVFLADAPGTVVAAGEAAMSGVVEPALAAPASAHGHAHAHRPPWEELERPADLDERRYWGPAWEHLEPAEQDAQRS